MKYTRLFISFMMLSLSATWAAEPPAAPTPGLRARDTADVGPKGSWSLGVFYPLRLALTDWFEVQTHPLLFFVAPNVTGRLALVRSAPVRVAAEASVAMPTLAMRLGRGLLFPSWETSQNNIGWMVTPRVGLLVSGGERARHVWTVSSDFTFRIGFTPTNAGPLNSFLAPLDLLLAAPLTGYVARVGAAGDFALSERFRLRIEGNVHLTGTNSRLVLEGPGDVGALGNLSPWYFTTHVGLDIAVGKQSRFTVGVYYANYDQGARETVKGADGFSERVRVRSNNILPTIDFVWSGGP
jgi:hypothetical protein